MLAKLRYRFACVDTLVAVAVGAIVVRTAAKSSLKELTVEISRAIQVTDGCTVPSYAITNIVAAGKGGCPDL